MRFPFLSTLPPVCPPGLLTLARGLGPPPRVALVNAGAATPLLGLREAAEAGLADPVLIGNPDRIRAGAEEIGWDIGGLRLVAADESEAEGAHRAAELAVAGEVDSIMKGQIHSSTFLEGLLPSSLGLRAKTDTCTHQFHITVPGSDRPLILTDAALTPGIPCTGEAAEIVAWAKQALPGVVVEGPVALDLILSADAARIKGYASVVAGDPDTIVVPEITTGNAIMKLMGLCMSACAGGIVMGARVPLLLTPRSQGAADRLASAALGAIVARGA